MSSTISPKSFIQKYSISLSKKPIRKRKRIIDNNFVIPTYDDYIFLETNNYRIAQLKEICRHYKLKIGGNKDELTFRIFNYLRLSKSAKKIQRFALACIANIYSKCRGKNWYKPSTWVNDTDFLTLSSWDTISPTQYFTCTNASGQIYGFDLITLATYLKKSKTPLNPYTREPFSIKTIERLTQAIALSNAFKINIQYEESEPDSVSLQQAIRHRIVALFQTIDSYNNYTESEWFSCLSKPQLIKFMRELIDIWAYRANLSNDKKREICPPTGNPFYRINVAQFQTMDLLSIQQAILGVLEKIVTSGVTQDDKNMGALYVLTALTLVSESAREAIPWLYDSVAPGSPS